MAVGTLPSEEKSFLKGSFFLNGTTFTRPPPINRTAINKELFAASLTESLFDLEL